MVRQDQYVRSLGLSRCTLVWQSVSQARHPALQLQPGLDGHWRPSLHRFGGLRVDDAIKNALLTVVGPGAIAAEKGAGQWRGQVREALGRDLARATPPTAPLLQRRPP